MSQTRRCSGATSSLLQMLLEFNCAPSLRMTRLCLFGMNRYSHSFAFTMKLGMKTRFERASTYVSGRCPSRLTLCVDLLHDIPNLTLCYLDSSSVPNMFVNLHQAHLFFPQDLCGPHTEEDFNPRKLLCNIVLNSTGRVQRYTTGVMLYKVS